MSHVYQDVARSQENSVHTPFRVEPIHKTRAHFRAFRKATNTAEKHWGWAQVSCILHGGILFNHRTLAAMRGVSKPLQRLPYFKVLRLERSNPKASRTGFAHHPVVKQSASVGIARRIRSA
eukprot:5272024-Amphidinium_carterae.1